MRCLGLWFFSGLLAANSNASIGPWRSVELVEVPAHRCLSLELDRTRLLCVNESAGISGISTFLFEVSLAEVNLAEVGLPEVSLKHTQPLIRKILELKDHSEICLGKTASVARFSGFESRDVDRDGRLDAVVLIRAGKLKRRGAATDCSSERIGTATYEVSYLNRKDGLTDWELSYPVLQRLQSLHAFAAE